MPAPKTIKIKRESKANLKRRYEVLYKVRNLYAVHIALTAADKEQLDKLISLLKMATQ